jgi:hypothetical protein
MLEELENELWRFGPGVIGGDSVGAPEKTN